jgi:DNA-directed RNA polymerase specialized sigma24 family protein
MSSETDKKFSTDEILQGIIEGRPEIFCFIRGKTFSFISNYIRLHNGRKSDCEEVFQDTLIVIFKKLKKNNLTLTCDFATYFIAVSKTIWRFEQKNKKKESAIYPVPECAEEKEIEDIYKESKEFKLYREYFGRLRTKQQEIIKASMNGESYDTLYQEFGYKNTGVFKNEVCRIKKKLIKDITSDKRFKNLNGNRNWSI